MSGGEHLHNFMAHNDKAEVVRSCLVGSGAMSQQRSGAGRFAGGQLGKTSSIQSGNRTTFPRHRR